MTALTVTGMRGRLRALAGETVLTSPPEVVRALIGLMRDRGFQSPYDLRGCTAPEIQECLLGRKKKPRSSMTLESALTESIAQGWVESYEIKGESHYLPNYRHGHTEHFKTRYPRNPRTSPRRARTHARGNDSNTNPHQHQE